LRKPVVLIPAYTHIDWRLSEALRFVAIPLIHVHGASDLVAARSRLLTDALKTSADTFVFVDADMLPTPEQIVHLVESSRLTDTDAVSGVYAVGNGQVAAMTADGKPLELPNPEPHVRCLVAGMGFAAVTRNAIEKLRNRLPSVMDEGDREWHPYFLPMVIEHANVNGRPMNQYLSEDYSFWWRLKHLAGVQLWLDTKLVVGHCKAGPLFPKGFQAPPPV
jgi:hypothetical protein